MEVAPRYTLLTLFTLFTLSILFEVLYTAYACMPRYILFGKVRTLLEWWASAQIVGRVDGWWKDTPETLKTIRAPVVLKMTGSAMPKIYRVSQKKHSYKIFGLEIMLFTCSQTLWSGLRSSFTKWGTAPAFTTACKTTMSASRWRAWSLVQKFYKSVFSGTPCRWGEILNACQATFK